MAQHSPFEAGEMNNIVPETELSLEETNEAQLMLMEIWANTYGEAFRMLIKSDPTLVDRYHANPEVCVSEIMEKLEEMKKLSLH